jgi:ArsR family transcriptional regulator
MTANAPRPAGASIDQLFRVLGDRTRLRLVNLMTGRDICVCYLVEVLRVSQPKISRHLAFLRRAGLVDARREGKWMHYRIAETNNPAVEQLLDQLKLLLTDDPQMQRDIERLNQASCPAHHFIRVKQAPVPTLLAGASRRRRKTARNRQ